MRRHRRSMMSRWRELLARACHEQHVADRGEGGGSCRQQVCAWCSRWRAMVGAIGKFTGAKPAAIVASSGGLRS